MDARLVEVFNRLSRGNGTISPQTAREAVVGAGVDVSSANRLLRLAYADPDVAQGVSCPQFIITMRVAYEVKKGCETLPTLSPGLMGRVYESLAGVRR